MNTQFFTKNKNGRYSSVDEDQVIEAALAILDRRLFREQKILNDSEARAFFSLKLGHLEREVFAAVFLDSQCRVIEYAEMFAGTVSQACVHPRELVKKALQCNCSAVIVSHNHPSGVPEPSKADIELTKTLKATMALVDVRVIDHIVVGGGSAVSFANRFLL